MEKFTWWFKSTRKWEREGERNELVAEILVPLETITRNLFGNNSQLIRSNKLPLPMRMTKSFQREKALECCNEWDTGKLSRWKIVKIYIIYSLCRCRNARLNTSELLSRYGKVSAEKVFCYRLRDVLVWCWKAFGAFFCWMKVLHTLLFSAADKVEKGKTVFIVPLRQLNRDLLEERFGIRSGVDL